MSDLSVGIGIIKNGPTVMRFYEIAADTPYLARLFLQGDVKTTLDKAGLWARLSGGCSDEACVPVLTALLARYTDSAAAAAVDDCGDDAAALKRLLTLVLSGAAGRGDARLADLTCRVAHAVCAAVPAARAVLLSADLIAALMAVLRQPGGETQ